MGITQTFQTHIALCAPFMPNEKAGNVKTKKGSMLERLNLSSETIEILITRAYSQR